MATKTINLNVLTRLNLEGFLLNQPAEANEATEMLFDLVERFKLTPDERAKFIIKTPVGVAVDETAMAAEPDLPVEIDSDEARKLLTLLKNPTGLRTVDVIWTRPLRKALDT